MSLIYEPKGAAKEYIKDGYALNIYKGCTHGCTYCYNCQSRFIDTEKYLNDAQPKEHFIENLKKEAPKFTGQKVFLSFLSDPFQPAEYKYRLTFQALEIFFDNNISPVILTKGKVQQEYFELLCAMDTYSDREINVKIGSTITFLDSSSAQRFEPYASPVYKRREMLQRAKNLDLKTWVSLEPVLSFEDVHKIIEHTHDYVDEYKIGKLNHIKQENPLNWDYFVKKTKDLLERYDKQYYFKENLQPYV